MSQILTVTVEWKDPILLTFQDHTADTLQLNWTVPLLFLIIYYYYFSFLAVELQLATRTGTIVTLSLIPSVKKKTMNYFMHC